MLRFINIENLAVINSLQIEFRPGLNVLSGETGSGKSIIIDALGLLLGERASADMIRTGSDKAFVEGVFEIAGNDPLIDLLGESGIDLGDEDLIIRRELSGSGRGRIFINNRAASASQLKSIQPHVIDLHGQGDQQSLLRAEAHISLLDAFGNSNAGRQKTLQEYERLLELARDLESSRQSESERLKALDMIEFQVGEIEKANLQPNEDSALEAERILLANAEKLASLCSEVYSHIYEDENSALTRLGTAQRRLGELTDVDPSFSASMEQLIAAKHLLDDVALSIRDYVDGIHASPERLKLVEDRLLDLDRLKRKYGQSLEEIIATRDALLERRDQLQRSEERANELESLLEAALTQYREQARKLSDSRRSAARKFEKAIAKELDDVALGAARFSINFSDPSPGQLTEKLKALLGKDVGVLKRNGTEAIEFYFSANPGEELRPISAVASGGELSRLMLVLKTITAPSLFPRTLIFDEIDAGIGGKVADAVGLRLKRLAETNQVLCVTHQSQIARYADAHFQVSKSVSGGRTLTSVSELDREGRIDELARMIGGAEVTPLARKHAKELLRIGG